MDYVPVVTLGMVLTGTVPGWAWANPQGGKVSAGAATIRQSGNRVDIHQSSNRAIIDWRSFSIGASEVTEFHQPSSGSIALNRVTGADPSHIFGTLRANGQVVLVNPNGVLFGRGSRVDVAGLVATTTDIRNRDFMSGTMEFSIPSSNPRAAVVNEGQITIAEAGYAALVAPHVRNSGIIDARIGRVTLGAAETFALDLYGDELITFRVGVRRTPVDADGTPVDSLVANSGQILADGGTVRLAAKNVEAVVRSVINTDGIVFANAIERRNGKIIIKAAGPGTVQAAGDLSALGGEIEIAGNDDVAVTRARIEASRIAILGDADHSGAGDLNTAPSGGDVVLTDVDIVTRGADALGGRVAITGDRVALQGNTIIDASGAAGGGDVLIGGEFQGKGALRNADATIIGSDAEIRVDAEEAGDGGRVIVWADGYTRFHGNIVANGAATAGDGGFVEVSGKQNLDFRGTVDLSAPAGNVGTLLLDPIDITVSSADNTDGANGGTVAFADNPAAEPWNVSPAALDAIAGNITLQATNDITVVDDINLTTAGATFTATAQNDVNINANLTTNGAAITLTADSDGSGAGNVVVAASKTVTTGDKVLSVTSNDLTLTGSLNSGGAATTLLVSDGNAITLGSGGGGDYSISAAELQNITATGLTIGDATNGTVTIRNIVAADSNNIAGTVILNATRAGTGVAFSGSGGTFNAVEINSNSAVDVSSSLVADTGGITINSMNGVTINEDTTAAGATTIDADSDNDGTGDFTVAATKTLNASNNALSITANDMTLPGSLNSGSAATTLLVSDGGTIGLGATAGNMTVSGSELQNITATGLTIGDATNGNITVDGITAANSNNISGTVTLNATADNAGISFATTASTFNALAANADDRIAVNIGVTTDTGNLALDGDADNAADTNDDVTIAAGVTVTSAGSLILDANTGGLNGAGAVTLNADDRVTLNNSLTAAGNVIIDGDADNAADANDDITLAAGITVTSSAGSITLDATTGNMTGAGALTLNATGGVTLNDSLTTAGTTTIDSDSDNNGAGTFTVAATKSLSTTNNTLSITADDMALSGTLNSGGAATTLLVSDGGTIGLGATAGNFTLSGAELQNITATGLTIGDATNGNITVDGITAANSNNITGTVTLNATQDNASIAFSNTASTFNALSANADDRISVNASVTTDTGNLALDGDADGAADTNDDIVFASGVTLTTAGGLTLNAATGGLNALGTLTLSSASGLTFGGNLTLAGITTFNADNDANGTGTFTVNSGATVSTSGNALTVIAADIDLTNGSLTSGAASTTLRATNGRSIGLGATAGDFTLSGAELQNITATGLTIGDATNGNITVDGITAANSNNITGTLTLNATADNASIAFSNTASTFNALAANADDRVAVNANVTTDTGNLALDGDADNAADTNDDITFAAGTTLTSAGSLTLQASTGGLTGAGALTLNGDNGVTLGAALTGSGNTTINADADANSSGNFTAATLNLGANNFTASGVNVNTGTSLIAGTVSLDGAITGSGLNVTSLTLTGANAALTSTTVGGNTDAAAATATTMVDASTHLVNGCQKSICATTESNDALADDLDAVTQSIGGDVGGGVSDSVGGGDAGGDLGGDTGGDVAEDSGGDSGSDTGGDAGGDVADDTGGDATGDTGGEVAGDAGGDVTGDAGGDVAGDTGGEVSGDGWSAGSFNALDGDQLLADNLEGGVDDFLQLLTQEDPEGAALRQAAENLGDPEIAELADALGDILGQYEIVMSSSIPGDAFGGSATTLIPGLLTFQPTADAKAEDDTEGSDFRPSGFAMFQF